MTAEEKHPVAKRDPMVILLLQFCLPISFTIAMAGVIGWIVSLIVLARKLQDVPSASIGISIVAIPVFLVLLSVFWYVFLGVILNQGDQPVSRDAGNSAVPGGAKE